MTEGESEKIVKKRKWFKSWIIVF